jgi:hypothetical protein
MRSCWWRCVLLRTREDSCRAARKSMATFAHARSERAGNCAQQPASGRLQLRSRGGVGARTRRAASSEMQLTSAFFRHARSAAKREQKTLGCLRCMRLCIALNTHARTRARRCTLHARARHTPPRRQPRGKYPARCTTAAARVLVRSVPPPSVRRPPRAQHATRPSAHHSVPSTPRLLTPALRARLQRSALATPRSAVHNPRTQSQQPTPRHISAFTQCRPGCWTRCRP